MLSRNDIKKGISDIWEKTFHYSKDFIQLVLNSYYNDDYVEFYIEDNRVVSALLGIPFIFGYGDNQLKGLLVYGAATDEKFYHKGLMSQLIENFNKKHQQDFDFSFLIPNSDLVADFFRRREYFNSFYRIEQRFTSVHDFYNDFVVSLYNIDQRVRSLKENLFNEINVDLFDFNSLEISNEIFEFIKGWEDKPRTSAVLNHTVTDFFTYISNCQINDISLFVAFNDGKICGLAFAKKEEMKRLNIQNIYFNDNCTYYAILNYVKKYFPDYSLSVYGASEFLSPSVIEEVYGAPNPDGGDLDTVFGLLETQFNPTKLMEPSGMVRLLKYDSIIKFIAKSRKEAEFKLYLRDLDYSENNEAVYFNVKNGSVLMNKYQVEKGDKSVLTLTKKEFSELLLRRKDSNNLIMEAFGIPRLILEMKLMLK